MRKIPELDSFDRRLLDLVRRNNLEPARTLAEKVGLSISAVLRRLRRLRDDKVIVADVALVDPKLTGSALTIHVLVQMKEPGHHALDGLARKLARYPEVAGAWEVTGDDDFVIQVQIGSMEEYDAFTRHAFDEQVKSFKSLITIRTVVRDDPARRPLLER